MFGKKAPPPPPYTLQVLTIDYLIDGTVAGDTELSFANIGSTMTFIQMTSVRIQTTRPIDRPIQTYAQFSVPCGATTVAFIPQIEPSRMQNYRLWEASYNKRLRGVIFAGPYLVQGTMMVSGDNKYVGHDVPVLEVHITSQEPGGHWGELRAPFALLNCQWLQGYAPG